MIHFVNNYQELLAITEEVVPATSALIKFCVKVYDLYTLDIYII